MAHPEVKDLPRRMVACRNVGKDILGKSEQVNDPTDKEACATIQDNWLK